MRGSVPSPRPLAGTARPGTAQVFRFAAGLAWRRQGAGVQVLEGNLRRVIGVEASGGELRALSRQAMHSYARYWLEAFRLPVVPVDRLVGVPVDQRGTRHRPVSRSRRPRRGPSIREAALMPGIIRCPESTAIQAGNPDHRGRGEEPGVSACSGSRGSDSGSAWSTLAPRCRRRPAQRSLCAAGAEAVVAADGCLPAGRYRCAGRRPAVRAARQRSRHEC
jgi:hypothetical protein